MEHDDLESLRTVFGDDAGLQPGLVLGRYRLEAEAGRGAMGVVWRARDTRLDEDVALKFLPSILAREPDRIRRLEEEARILLRLTHPALLRLHNLEEVEGRVFLLMEYLAGPDLKTLLRSRRERGETGLTPEEARWVLAQVAPGLDHAHGQGVFHRDLKPANLVLTAQPGKPLGSAGETLKITDFGIAHLARRTIADLTGVPLAGTPAYMAPEAWNATVPTVAMDVFALGASLFELVTGSLPFPDGCAGGRRQAPPLRSGDARLDTAVAAMLALDPARRPGTAGEAARLAGCCEEVPRGSGRRRWWYLVAAAAVLAAGTTVYELRPWQTPRPRQEPGPGRQGPPQGAVQDEPETLAPGVEEPDAAVTMGEDDRTSPVETPAPAIPEVQVLGWGPTTAVLAGDAVELRLEVTAPARVRVVQRANDASTPTVLLEQALPAGTASLRFTVPPPAGQASKGVVPLRVEISPPERPVSWTRGLVLTVVDRDRARAEVAADCRGAAAEARALAGEGRAREGWQRARSALAGLDDWPPLAAESFADVDAVIDLRVLAQRIVTEAWTAIWGRTEWPDAGAVEGDRQALAWLRGLVEADAAENLGQMERWLAGFLRCGPEIIANYVRPRRSTAVTWCAVRRAEFPAALVSRVHADVEMVFVPGGTFVLGIPEAEMAQLSGVDFDDPGAARVRISGFYMSRCELSRGSVAAVAPDLLARAAPRWARDPALRPDLGGYPCTNLSWEEAAEVAGAFHARLPAEAQWEYAASGPSGVAVLGRYLEDPASARPIPVRGTRATADDLSWCGIEGLGGNVREWCRDAWRADRLRMLERDVLDPPAYAAPGIGAHVVRGGDWRMLAADRHTGARRYASRGSPFIGLRLVLDPVLAE